MVGCSIGLILGTLVYSRSALIRTNAQQTALSGVRSLLKKNATSVGFRRFIIIIIIMLSKAAIRLALILAYLKISTPSS